MISCREAFEWLNHEDSSHLTKGSIISLREIHDLREARRDQESYIDAFLHCAREMQDALEYAEVLASIASIRYEQGQREEARRLMLEAARVYRQEKDRHRQAVTEWCLFNLRRKLLEPNQAYAHARSAQSLFHEQVNHYAKMGDPEVKRVLWYRERLADMLCDLIMTPENAFEWINQFDGSCLTCVDQELRQNIRSDIENMFFDDAYRQIQSMRKICVKAPNPIETAEVLAFCGLSMQQMGNRAESIKLLRTALAHADPACHAHTSIRWLLGLVQYGMLTERENGMMNLEKSLQYFEDLRHRAHQRDQKSAMQWYDKQLVAMRRVVKEFVRSEA